VVTSVNSVYSCCSSMKKICFGSLFMFEVDLGVVRVG
jgi:hypothetical protein